MSKKPNPAQAEPEGKEISDMTSSTANISWMRIRRRAIFIGVFVMTLSLTLEQGAGRQDKTLFWDSLGALPLSQAHAEEKTSQKPATQQAKPNKKQHDIATFSGLDKITARIIEFDVNLNETVQFGALQITPKVCYTYPDQQKRQTTTFVQVDEITLEGKLKPLFSGWMFAESPGLNAIEHPVYDIWLKGCKIKAVEAAKKAANNAAVVDDAAPSEVFEDIQIAPNIPLRTPPPRGKPANQSTLDTAQ